MKGTFKIDMRRVAFCFTLLLSATPCSSYSTVAWPRAVKAVEPTSCSSYRTIISRPRASNIVLSAKPPPDPAPLSTRLIVTDSAAIAVFALGVSSFKALSLAVSDLTSPEFSIVDDLSSFNPAVIAQFVNCENFGAACLVLGWLVGGAFSGACADDWEQEEPRKQWQALVTGWVAAAPLAFVLKYGFLANADLPSLGQTAQAIALEAQLAGLTVPNVLTDTVGMLLVMVLWRRWLLQNPTMFL